MNLENLPENWLVNVQVEHPRLEEFKEIFRGMSNWWWAFDSTYYGRIDNTYSWYKPVYSKYEISLDKFFEILDWKPKFGELVYIDKDCEKERRYIGFDEERHWFVAIKYTPNFDSGIESVIRSCNQVYQIKEVEVTEQQIREALNIDKNTKIKII